MSTYTRRGTVESHGHTAGYEITKHGKSGYRLEVTYRHADGPAISTQLFSKPEGTTVEREARRLALIALGKAAEESTKNHLYIRVEGLPGYAHEDVEHLTSGMTEAAYWMDHRRHLPVTVYRVFFESDADVQRFVDEVSGKDYSDTEQPVSYSAEVTTTRDPLAAFKDVERWGWFSDGISQMAYRARGGKR